MGAGQPSPGHRRATGASRSRGAWDLPVHIRCDQASMRPAYSPFRVNISSCQIFLEKLRARGVGAPRVRGSLISCERAVSCERGAYCVLVSRPGARPLAVRLCEWRPLAGAAPAFAEAAPAVGLGAPQVGWVAPAVGPFSFV